MTIVVAAKVCNKLYTYLLDGLPSRNAVYFSKCGGYVLFKLKLKLFIVYIPKIKYHLFSCLAIVS